MQTKPELRKKFTDRLAIWHWVNLLLIAFILLTVLMVKTIFNSRANIPVVQAALEKKGVVIDNEQARAVTKLYSKQLWDWHVYFGYVLAAFFLYRILLEFFQPGDSKFFFRFKQARQYFKSGQSINDAKHHLGVKLAYVLFYLDLFMMVSTGLFIKFSSDYPKLKPVKEFLKEVHNVGMYIMLAFILAHLLGLLIDDRKQKAVK